MYVPLVPPVIERHESDHGSTKPDYAARILIGRHSVTDIFAGREIDLLKRPLVTPVKEKSLARPNPDIPIVVLTKRSETALPIRNMLECGIGGDFSGGGIQRNEIGLSADPKDTVSPEQQARDVGTGDDASISRLKRMQYKFSCRPIVRL